MPLAPRSPKPRMREPSVTTTTWQCARGQFRIIVPISPRSSGVKNMPRARWKVSEKFWQTRPTVGVYTSGAISPISSISTRWKSVSFRL